MTRGRLCTFCAMRLAIYLAAIITVRHAAASSMARDRIAPLEAAATDLTEPLLALLLLGMLLEIVSGAARWR